MVGKCCVPNCRGNYDKVNRASVFRFPSEQKLRSKWLSAICRENYEPSKNSVVCELHFAPSDVIRGTMFYSEDGQEIPLRLEKPRLVPGAVPSVLPNCPAYLSKKCTRRESPEVKKRKRECQQLQQAITESAAEHEVSLQKRLRERRRRLENERLMMMTMMAAAATSSAAAEATTAATAEFSGPCDCGARADALQARICRAERLLERVLGELEAAERLRPRAGGGDGDAGDGGCGGGDGGRGAESVVLGQPGGAPPVSLHDAAERGQACALARALVGGADPNARDTYGDSPLHCAARQGHALAAEMLLAAGAGLDEPDARGATPLAVAASRGRHALAKLLLEKGAKTEAADSEGRTALVRAVLLGDSAMVALLVEGGAAPWELEGQELAVVAPSAVVAAAHECLTDILQLLLSAKPRVVGCGPQPPPDLPTSLVRRAMAAAGSPAAFLALHAAAPHAAACGHRHSMLARVAKEGWFRPLSALLKNCFDQGCNDKIHLKNLQCAIRVVKTEGLLEMLWLNSQTQTRAAVMRRAASMGWVSLLERTLQHWKKFPWRSYEPSDFPVSLRGQKLGYIEITEALRASADDRVAFELVKACPKIAQTFVGEETMRRAAENGWFQVLHKLIKCDVPVNAVGREGSTSLHLAIARGQEECVQMLVTNGASLEAKDDDGWTPLHCAADRGNKRMVEILLAAGADPTAKDPFGLTPWDVASSGSIMAMIPRGLKREQVKETDTVTSFFVD